MKNQAITSALALALALVSFTPIEADGIRGSERELETAPILCYADDNWSKCKNGKQSIVLKKYDKNRKCISATLKTQTCKDCGGIYWSVCYDNGIQRQVQDQWIPKFQECLVARVPNGKERSCKPGNL
jgi:hypothetical protein